MTQPSSEIWENNWYTGRQRKFILNLPFLYRKLMVMYKFVYMHTLDRGKSLLYILTKFDVFLRNVIIAKIGDLLYD